MLEQPTPKDNKFNRRPSVVQFSNGTSEFDGPSNRSLVRSNSTEDRLSASGRVSEISSYNHTERFEMNSSAPAQDNTSAGDNTSAANSKSISSRLNRPDIVKPPGPFGDFRFACGKFINHPYSEHFITFIIFCNTITLILSTFDFVQDDKKITDIVEVLDYVFLGIFSVESGLQLIYHDIKIFKNRWLSFDLLLVLSSWVFQTFTVLRCLRIFKIASKFEALQRLITALLDVIPNITAIFSLLLLVFYIFAVMFTQLFKDLDLELDYFSRLDKTLFSLFQFMTMDWQEAARDCAQYISWAPLLFVLFEIVSGFIVFNLIVAVLCEALGLLEKDAEEEKLQAEVEKERIDTMNNLLERVETIRKHQLTIQQNLRDIAT